MRTRNNIILYDIILNNRGCGGIVENSEDHTQSVAIPDPLRHVQRWIASVAEGLIDSNSLGLLQSYVDQARHEIAEGFVPLGATTLVAAPKPEFGREPHDMGTNSHTASDGAVNDG